MSIQAAGALPLVLDQLAEVWISRAKEELYPVLKIMLVEDAAGS